MHLALERLVPEFAADVETTVRDAIAAETGGAPPNPADVKAEVHERLLFGTDYPLSVLHIAAWGRVAFRTLWHIIRTKNRFDRQVAVCQGLGVGFRSLGDVVNQSGARSTRV